MKKYFNYIFIFMVCFVFLGEVKAIKKFTRVSREEFGNAKNPLVFCYTKSDGKNTCGKNALSSSIVKVLRLYNDGTERALKVNPNSANIGDKNGKNYSYGNIDRIERKNFDFITIPKDRIETGPVSIAVYYNNVGKYNGEYINVKAIYTVYIYGSWAFSPERGFYEHSNLKKYHLTGFDGLIIMIPHNFNGSVGFFHSAYDKVRYEFTDQDGHSINIQNGKLLLLSLNDKADALNESVFFPVEMSKNITKYEYVNKYLHTEIPECQGTPNNLSLEDGGTSGTTRYSPDHGQSITYGSAIVPISNTCFFEDDYSKTTDEYANAAAFWFNSNYIEFYFASFKGNDPNGFELENFEIMFRPSSGSEYAKPPEDYDYSIDMACTNCNSTLKSNKAIYIQDTTDWEAITNSGNSSCTNAKNYFEIKKDSGIYCRSEYEVIYPNKDDIITVYTGRFFTLNAKDEEFESIVGTDKFVHNFKPISVNKMMQCKGNISGQESNLEKYFKEEGTNKDEDKSGGTITLTYKDNKKGTYDFENVTLKSKLDGGVSVKNSGGMVTFSAKYYFTLPDNFYRYVRNNDSFSIKDFNTIKDNNLANYMDLKISNIPLPFNEHKSGNKVRTIFKYSLPSRSKMKNAIKENNYFGCPTDVDISNLYKKADDNNSDDMLKDTACYKLYGKASLKNDKCVSDNLTKIKNCLSDDYYCDLPVSDGKTPPCDPTKEICDGDECNPNLQCCENCVEDFAKVIYRVIDVDNPFTYENGKIRNTGINWCSETLNDGKIDCSSNNSKVESKITDKKNVPEERALYVITLTPDIINQIRKYNKNYSYDYYNCDKDVSDFCRSELLNGTSSVGSLGITGNCSTNYKTCTN